MNDLSDLATFVDGFSNAHVICIGDVMLDRFVYGEVNRISPEAPIPVMRVGTENAMLGGAGNVARNITSLEAKVSFLSAVGKDAAGSEILKLIGEDSRIEPYLQIERNRPTTIKTRYIAGGQQLLRTDTETIEPITESNLETLLEIIRSSVTDQTVVILSDYGKGVLTDVAITSIISTVRTAGGQVIVDPKGTDYSRYRGATLITPNRKEIEGATGMSAASNEEAVAAATYLRNSYNIANVLVTRSQDGMTLVCDDDVSHLPAHAREVYDVSGAGDTVVATLAVALSSGVSLEKAARLANMAAGIVVAKIGTAVVYPDELISVLHQQDLMSGEAKLMPLERMVDRVARWRRKGYRIGFTNGCFDLLHPGHLSLLQQARSACDKLVVGLNSDASVKRLKGEARPVQSEAARAAVLGSIETVSGVVIFGEDTPLNLIEAIKPDLLVKGADYTVETVVGHEIVQSYGGRVMLANLEDGFSTTSTIKRINEG
jgi:D-beta-D-heptose 7-phosphate kinase/D-beta-D-heptose 1-phosphate adenosyltransferase